MWSNKRPGPCIGVPRYMTQLPNPSPEDPPRLPAAGVPALAIVAAAAALAAVLAWLLAGRTIAAPLAAAVAAALAVLPALLVLRAHRQALERHGRSQAPAEAGETPPGVAPRERFLEQAEREWARARRYGVGASMLVFEIDRFQRLSEQRGEAVARAALAALAAHTVPTLRGGDSIGCLGPAQLGVWLAQADALGAIDAAERIRDRAETLEIGGPGQALRLTISVGVAALRPAHGNLTALVDDADAALQAARLAGGNCVRAAPVDPARLRKIGPSVGDNQAAGPP